MANNPQKPSDLARIKRLKDDETHTVKGVFTQQQVVEALFASLTPIKEQLLEELAKADGQVLELRMTVQSDNTKLQYGIHPVDETLA